MFILLHILVFTLDQLRLLNNLATDVFKETYMDKILNRFGLYIYFLLPLSQQMLECTYFCTNVRKSKQNVWKKCIVNCNRSHLLARIHFMRFYIFNNFIYMILIII